MLKKFVIAAALTLAALAPATAHHPGETASKGDIQVSHGWTVATSSMAHAVEVYVTMWNEGESADKLVGADVPFADDAVIHQPVAGQECDCICLAVTDAPLKMTGPFGRILNYFVDM